MFTFDTCTPNILPSRYRQVALSDRAASLALPDLEQYFIGREAYMRTRFIVARKGVEVALIEVDRPESKALFSEIQTLRILAAPHECLYVIDPEIDCGVASQLALVASRHPGVRCVIVEGRYSHVSFIFNPEPLRLRVLDIVPPFPSKLLDQVERVLADAEDLPPIVVEPVLIDSRQELALSQLPSEHVLLPCRGSGIDLKGSTVSYLDERPTKGDWTLLGCERSHQIHRWFYGETLPKMVDVCPIRFAKESTSKAPLLTRCCLLQEGVEERPQGTFVPWGASLAEVRQAIETIVKREVPTWTPI